MPTRMVPHGGGARVQLIGGHPLVYVLIFGLFSVVGIVFTSYQRYVFVLKWLTLSLFAYVAA